jgi:hypothetical protein
MKHARWLWVFVVMLGATSGFAHGLGIGDILITKDTHGSQIETSEFIINQALVGDNDYSLTVGSKEFGLASTKTFFVGVPVDFELTALNVNNHCGETILFVTLRYDVPRGADILQYAFDTHAFRASDLAYLGSVDGDFYDIAPLEAGVDIGFAYEMPQAFGVACSAATDPGGFAFSFVPARQ